MSGVRGREMKLNHGYDADDYSLNLAGKQMRELERELEETKKRLKAAEQALQADPTETARLRRERRQQRWQLAIDIIEAYAHDGNWSKSDPTKWTATANGAQLAREFLAGKPQDPVAVINGLFRLVNDYGKPTKSGKS